MLIYLGLGVLVVFLLARLAIGAAENAIIGGIADGDVAGAARTMVDATLQDLRSITVLILIGTVVLIIAAYLWGRPKWVMATASYAGDTAGRAGSAAGAAASGGAASAAGRAPDRATVEDTVRDNRSAVEKYGIGIIVFILVWIAIGLEVALLGAALVIGFLLLLRAIDGGSDDDAAEVPVADGTITEARLVAATATPEDLPAAVEAPPLTPAASAAAATAAPAAPAAAPSSSATEAPAAEAPAAPAKKAPTPRKPAAKAPAKPPAKPKQPPKPKPPTS